MVIFTTSLSVMVLLLLFSADHSNYLVTSSYDGTAKVIFYF